MVMFVHREEYYMTPDEREKERQDGNPRGLLGGAKLSSPKQRNGPTGDVKLHWKHEFTRFEIPRTGRTTNSSNTSPAREPF